MEPRGLDFLHPIWWLTQAQGQFNDQNDEFVGLAPDQVRVYYRRYTNNFKQQFNPLKSDQISICDAIKDQLAPGKLLLVLV